MKTALFIQAATMLVTAAGAQVTLVRIPDDALQPKALVDARGITHLITHRGAASGGDLFYATRAAGGSSFSDSVRINSTPGSAVSAGTIRGAQFALGKDGRVR